MGHTFLSEPLESNLCHPASRMQCNQHIWPCLLKHSVVRVGFRSVECTTQSWELRLASSGFITGDHRTQRFGVYFFSLLDTQECCFVLGTMWSRTLCSYAACYPPCAHRNNIQKLLKSVLQEAGNSVLFFKT